MTVELKSRVWVDHRSEKWKNNRPIKIEAIPLTTSYGIELIPLFPYPGWRGGGGGGASRFEPVTRPFITDYGLKGFLISRLIQAWKKILLPFMSSF